ncbi:ABC transporter permease [Bacillus sp. FJAT-52991]|uniref:ABC transporter permease n=1 Tax=Bacillus kandeliae TaxID=3129297 RepID=A0ABZ2N732_9BACI
MSINQLILRNLKKNIKNYYLYIFALVFSVALYFAFVTLQYDPAMNEVEGSIKGAAAIRTTSILLVVIVWIFLLYANKIFMKRRSKEIGLFQLIGLTKNEIFRLLSIENFILYFSSLIIGTFGGFSISKLVMMILFNILGIEEVATLNFSMQAFIQTLIVFTAIYLFILLTNYIFIKKQTILSLFKVTSTTEGKVKKISIFEIILGITGIVSIAVGYYTSSRLFFGDYTTMQELFLAMTFILTTVIVGTYLFYRGSVRFIGNIIRKKKDGHLNINDVLSLSSIMFRMKSNAMLLTIITTVSALAIGLLSLSYISYYSAEKTGKNYVPHDFSMTNEQQAKQLTKEFEAQGISYSEQKIEVLQVEVDLKQILDTEEDSPSLPSETMPFPVISDEVIKDMDLSADEAMFFGYADMFKKFMPLKETGQIGLKGKSKVLTQKYVGLSKEFIVAFYFTAGGLPTLVVDDTIFDRLKKDLDPAIQKESSIYIGINIKDETKVEKANEIFKQFPFSEELANHSQLEMITQQKSNMGLIMFIVGFLGLTFLITSGCILYFKQMDESEEERDSYTILRKLGYTQSDLLKGIQIKQLFNFGIPLIIGLLHSYFAVQSGWFLFGTELWTPMIIVMVIYTGLYSIFGLLSVLYYKKVIKEAL